MPPARLLAPVALLLAGAALTAPIARATGQQAAAQPTFPPIATTEFRLGGFTGALRADTQTLARLSPAEAATFSFVPTHREAERAGDGYNHLGDINLRLRTAGGEWQDFASARARRPIRPLAGGAGVIAAADITASMGETVPLTVERRWVDEDGRLALRFRLTNRTGQPVEIGGLGMPMVFDNMIVGRSLDEAHTQASFVDPYIGRDAGYLQVTRLNGAGPALLVLPEAGSPLEAYAPLLNPGDRSARPIFTDLSPRGQTSEGFYDWTVHSKAFAEREWADAEGEWNIPTSRMLAPGESMDVGVRLALSPGIREIERTLIAERRPVAIGVPGYVVPTDHAATLFVNAPSRITAIESHPAGALTTTRAGTVNGWTRLSVRSSGFGPARLTLRYADGTHQTVSYYVTKPLAETVGDLGRFSTTRQWFERPDDPFGRSPGILTYDREADRIVDVEPRVWIAGMSDEGGAGAWVAAVMKQLDNPVPEEVAKIERMVNETIVGNLQVPDGAQAGGVRKSLFYYDPARFPNLYAQPDRWRSWTSWTREGADDLGRAYNYPHVAIAHWVLYRLARNHQGLTSRQDWRWYLANAQRTIVAMTRDAPHYAVFGLMQGDVFVDILKDLQREGMTAEATELEGLMRARADHWRSLAYPFGSEMPWDSTGQPEVYAWMRYFGHQPQADMTREVILGYDPAVPSWGYNGNARRYWDFIYAGKRQRLERQLHHYGSTLNAVPLFDAFRQNPSDIHLLRVAYGGLMGGITNIDQRGFSSAGFHSNPDAMAWDAYTGDYGMGFFGHAYATASYLVNDPTFGWLGFGGTVEAGRRRVTIVPNDSARTRLFVAPAGQWITLTAGKIAQADYAPRTGRITLTLDPAESHTRQARLAVETTSGERRYRPSEGQPERGAYTIALTGARKTITLDPQ